MAFYIQPPTVRNGDKIKIRVRAFQFSHDCLEFEFGHPPFIAPRPLLYPARRLFIIRHSRWRGLHLSPVVSLTSYEANYPLVRVGFPPKLTPKQKQKKKMNTIFCMHAGTVTETLYVLINVK